MGEDLQHYIKRIKEGDEQAFQYVYNQTKDEVYRTVRYLVNCQADVCDIVSEIYLEMIRSIEKYDNRKPFRSWLSGLAVRQTSNWNRKLWRMFRIVEKKKQFLDTQVEESPENKAVSDEKSRELFHLLGGLSYKLRVVIVLRYYQQKSLAEIAETLRIPLGTVKSRHDSAIKKLRDAATHHFEEKETVLHVY